MYISEDDYETVVSSFNLFTCMFSVDCLMLVGLLVVWFVGWLIGWLVG